MKKIVILSYFIAFAFVVLFPRSFIFAAEETENYEIPFRGSLTALFTVTSLFMMSALGQGLIISTLSKNQYVASFAALLSAFLPVVLLSGFIFELNSMPFVQRAIAAVLPARLHRQTDNRICHSNGIGNILQIGAF